MQLKTDRKETLLPIHGGILKPSNVGGWKYRLPQFLARPAPCSVACPLGNPIEAMLRDVALGLPEAAAARMRETNPFPAILGRVCPHPCERDCNRKQLDASLAISALERMAGEVALEDRWAGSRSAEQDRDGVPVAVIGAGPSGLACAELLVRLGHKPTLFEAQSEPGGMMRYGIPAYRLAREVIAAETERIVRGGVEIRTGVRIGKDLSIEDLRSRGYRAVYAATGAWIPRRPPEVPVDAEDVLSGSGFLHSLNSGGAPGCRGRVVVIGGGDVAIDVARSAVRLGAEKVTMVALEARDRLPAVREGIEQAETEGVRIAAGLQVDELTRRPGGVKRLRARRVRLLGFDANGARTRNLGGKPVEIDADLLVFATGQDPGDPVAEDEALPILTGGDAAGRGGTIARAAADGKRAALAIDGILRGTPGASADESKARAEPVGFSEINTAYFRPAARSVPPTTTKGFDPENPFRETVAGIGWEAAREEAARCFHCGFCTGCENCFLFCPDMAVVRPSDDGLYAVDLSRCKGCGICAVECPRAVIRMVRAGGVIDGSAAGRAE